MAKKTRKTSDGRHVLKSGEYERKRGGFEYKFVDASGVRCSVSAATLQELREKEKTCTRNNSDGVATSKGRKTLDFYYEKWKKTKRGLKPRTFNNYVYMYEHFVRPELGGRKIETLKHSVIKEFYCKLIDKKILAINTLDNIQNVLYQVFSLAVQDDCIRINPCEKTMKEIKREFVHEKKKSLTPAEQERFKACIKDTAWEPLFGIMLRTGLRIGEVAGLTWDDIDEDAGVLHVRRSLNYFKDQAQGEMLRIVSTPKTSAGCRDLPLSDELKALFELQRTTGKKCTVAIDGVSNFVFGTKIGGTIQQGTVNKAIKRIVRDANLEAGEDDVLIPDFSCHCLRRTFATNCVRAGVSLPVLMAWMGHADVDTTMAFYVEVQGDMSDIADEAVRKYIEEIAEMANKREQKRRAKA